MSSPDGPVSYPDGYHDFHFGVEDASFWFRHRNRVIVEAVRGFPPVGGRPIVDIGGGNGYVTLGIEKAGFPTVLVEPGVAGVLNARRRGLSAVICATAEAARLRDGALGGFGMFDVLEHIRDDVGFLAGLGRKLAPGGRAYVAVPAFNALWSAEDDRSGTSGDTPSRRWPRRSSPPGSRSSTGRTSSGAFPRPSWSSGRCPPCSASGSGSTPPSSTASTGPTTAPSPGRSRGCWRPSCPGSGVSDVCRSVAVVWSSLGGRALQLPPGTDRSHPGHHSVVWITPTILLTPKREILTL